MASEKGREDNQHDKSRDDKDVTAITNAPHRLEELRTTVQNLQWNRAKHQYIKHEEFGDSQQESLRQEQFPPLVIRQETLYDRFNRFENQGSLKTLWTLMKQKNLGANFALRKEEQPDADTRQPERELINL